MKPKYFVDLFAGCGGLSLGLENAGFTPAYVNEIDPDALESYLINRDENFPLLRKKYNSQGVQNLTKKKNALDNLSLDFQEDYGFKNKELDLVVGGPPCQGFSALGMRRTQLLPRKDVPSNYLYKDMIKIIQSFSPKAFLFENVAGLMTGRWSPNGKKGEIWKDVEKSFRKLADYNIHYELLHAKDYGVPQNRPRIIMVGLRKDFSYENDVTLPGNGLLPNPKNDFPNILELFDDILDNDYLNTLDTPTYPKNPRTTIQKKLRTTRNGTVLMKGDKLTEHKYSKHSKKIIEKFQYMIENNGGILEKMKTKKFVQRVIPKVWGKNGPNITATSLPDDFVHYAQPRIPTVREWARLQTFPDWYQFAGKRTTGGIRRAGNPREGLHERELPKYTQIGNSVPVLLAEAVGLHFRTLLKH